MVSRWIWQNTDSSPDSYVNFKKSFYLKSIGRVEIEISCDTCYCLYVNGIFVGSDWFYDYEHYKMRDKIDISEFCVTGENVIELLVWYIGMPSQNYAVGKAGLLFTIFQDSEIIAVSDKNVLCRTERKFTGQLKRYINKNLGLSFEYNNNVVEEEYQPSVETDKYVTFADSCLSLKNLVIEDWKKGVIIETGNRYVVDFGREVFGFIGFDLYSEYDNLKITVYFGEYLKNGLVSGKYKGDENFCFSFIAKKGKNRFENNLRALGLRYLQFDYSDGTILENCFIRQVRYPFDKKQFVAETALQQDIYDKCIYTLECCTSKHYFDCPWREQSMYVLDCRNQMLFGYKAFNGYELQKFNLRFIAESLNDCGFLPPAPPGQTDRVIPFFNLVFVLQCYEYYNYTKDAETIKSVEKTLDVIINNIILRIGEKGIVPHFEKPFWNFYEWSDGNDNWLNDLNSDDEQRKNTFDVIFNCTFVIAIECYKKIKKILGVEFVFNTDDFRKAIKRYFYNEDVGLFSNLIHGNTYSKLGNSMAILADVLSEEENASLARKLVEEKNITDISLSSLSFYYDALLKVNPSYKKFIISDIEEKYSGMIEKGATAFWETLGGPQDFDGSGSMCHGWSAIPLLYLENSIK